MVPSTVIGIDRSQDAEEWSSKTHLACMLHPINIPVPPPFIAPPPPSANPPQDQSSLISIAGDLRLLHDATERQHLRKISNKEEKKTAQTVGRNFQKKYKQWYYAFRQYPMKSNIQVQQIPTLRSWNNPKLLASPWFWIWASLWKVAKQRSPSQWLMRKNGKI
jgi:hypothetical protein